MPSSEPLERAAPPWAAGTEFREHELDPVLSETEVSIVRRYGEERVVEDGTLLWDVGDREQSFHLILEGFIEVFRREPDGDHPVMIHGPGHYTGETVSMSGYGSLLAGRAKGNARVVAVSRKRLREMLAVEARLGPKILLSFILRRMRMVALHLGDVFVVGDKDDPATDRIRAFLSRNGVPHHVVGPGSEQGRAAIADRPQPGGVELPCVVCNHVVLSRPTNLQIAELLGITEPLEDNAQFDLAVIGAGPAGLAAAVYGASEGLRVVVIESSAPGGQAGTTSRIENYLGFPTGISGQALATRAFLQAQKFGAVIAIARELETLCSGDPEHELTLDGGTRIRARAVVLATGAVYRRPSIEGLADFEGRGVHYGAAYMEAQLCNRQNVVIVGGGNSAGQAAVYLSDFANRVYIVVRGEGVAHSMSDYLIQRIQRLANVELITRTEIARVEGIDHVASLVAEDNQTHERRRLEASHLFIFTGAEPSTGFADPSLLLDQKRFVKTGDALDPAALEEAGWQLDRRPYPLETSCPRVFAVGDVRSGSVKRVAAAVGEGSAAIQMVHKAMED